MDKSILVKKLDAATDNALLIAIKTNIPINVTSKSTLIGNLIVRKNKKGFYDIIKSDNNRIFTDISVFDIAVILAQRYNRQEFSVIKKVLILEEKYYKYHSDMENYLRCMRSAKIEKDFERLSILEDKFRFSEIRIKNLKDSIASYKKHK